MITARKNAIFFFIRFLSFKKFMTY